MSGNSVSGSGGQLDNAGQGYSDNAMCDQREQLIGYLYDECTRDERRAVEAHLQECSTCREEIGDFGAVRQDLLAWDVPRYESVWRPFVAPRTTSPWREMPAWAMAAAATLVFLAGAAGGAATTAVTAAMKPAQVAASVTPADLAALRAGVIAEVHTAMAQRVVPTAVRETTKNPLPSDVPSAVVLDSMAARLASIEDWRAQQTQLNVGFLQDIKQIGSRYSSLNSQMAANRQPDGFQLINYGIEGR